MPTPPILAGEDCGELSCGQGSEDTGLLGILEGQAVGRQLRSGSRVIAPVIVRAKRGAVSILDLMVGSARTMFNPNRLSDGPMPRSATRVVFG